MNRSRRPVKRVTQSDVARAAGVSTITVSRVMRGAHPVDAHTREHVLSVVRELGYRPDNSASALAGARRDRISLLHMDRSTDSLSRILIGVIEESSDLGVQMMTSRVDSMHADPSRTVRRLAADGAVGVILAPPLGESRPLLAALQSARMPAVAIALGTARDDIMCVGIDEHGAAYEMTRHLLELGHRRIAFIRGHPGRSASNERWRGFAAAVRDSGIDSGRIAVEQGQCTYRSGVEAAKRLLDASHAPTAIFASSGDMAAGAAAAAYHRGLDVPRALTVVGFDDCHAAGALWPEITAIRQPLTEMAAEAVRMLMDAIRSGSEGRHGACRKKLVGHHLQLTSSAPG
jgi:LacI family transcriptional regulator